MVASLYTRGGIDRSSRLKERSDHGRHGLPVMMAKYTEDMQSSPSLTESSGSSGDAPGTDKNEPEKVKGLSIPSNFVCHYFIHPRNPTRKTKEVTCPQADCVAPKEVILHSRAGKMKNHLKREYERHKVTDSGTLLQWLQERMKVCASGATCEESVENKLLNFMSNGEHEDVCLRTFYGILEGQHHRPAITPVLRPDRSLFQFWTGLCDCAHKRSDWEAFSVPYKHNKLDQLDHFKNIWVQAEAACIMKANAPSISGQSGYDAPGWIALDKSDKRRNFAVPIDRFRLKHGNIGLLEHRFDTQAGRVNQISITENTGHKELVRNFPIRRFPLINGLESWPAAMPTETDPGWQDWQNQLASPEFANNLFNSREASQHQLGIYSYCHTHYIFERLLAAVQGPADELYCGQCSPSVEQDLLFLGRKAATVRQIWHIDLRVLITDVPPGRYKGHWLVERFDPLRRHPSRYQANLEGQFQPAEFSYFEHPYQYPCWHPETYSGTKDNYQAKFLELAVGKPKSFSDSPVGAGMTSLLLPSCMRHHSSLGHHLFEPDRVAIKKVEAYTGWDQGWQRLSGNEVELGPEDGNELLVTISSPGSELKKSGMRFGGFILERLEPETDTMHEDSSIAKP